MDKVLLVIPAYNEGKNIERVVDHIKNDFPELDYVVVNDGSKDDTADICRRRGYNFIDLPVNLGLAGCFQTGMKYAWQKGYNYAVQFDGDGQHRPEYIQAMKEKMDEGYDIVIGSRFVTEKKSLHRGLAGAGRAIGHQRAVNVEHSRFDLHANHPFRRPRRRRFRRSFPPLRPS